jgi:hypothetical protein
VPSNPDVISSSTPGMNTEPAVICSAIQGVGETRLVTQFAISRPPPWAGGWLHAERGASALDAVRACGDPALILTDDADTSPDTAIILVGLLAKALKRAGALLIARTADSLAQITRQLPQHARWIIAADNLPIRPLADSDTRPAGHTRTASP